MFRRILLLVTDLEIGGTPTVVRELAIRLPGVGSVEIEVACLAPWGPVADQLRDAGVTVTALGARGPVSLGVIPSLIRLIRRRRFDTVVSFLLHANAVAAVASLFCRGVRFIQSIQTTQPYPRWHWLVQKIAQHRAERIVAPSESIAGVARQWADVPAEKIVVIPNAVEIHSLDRHPQLPETIEVGFLGRLDPIKRVPDLVQAMALLDDRFELHIFGDGPQRSAVEAEVDRLGLRSRVTLHGMTAKPQAVFGSIDLLVLPSEAEGFGLVLIEAMAAGVPVIATNAPGIRDVVRDGQTGLLVPVGSPNELANAIRRIAGDPALREMLVRNGLTDVESRFSWDHVLRSYRKLLEIGVT